MDAAPFHYWDILDNQQRQILTLLADGWLTGEVAIRMGLSYGAFGASMRTIYDRLKLKLGRRNPLNAIWKAYIFGEIELPKWAESADLKGMG